MTHTNPTIFLADDDQDDRLFFEEVLEEISSKIHFTTFDNGADLMKNLLNESNKTPDFIFLDLKMPIMDGEECLQEIRKLNHLSKTPIIIYSTSIDVSKAERLRDLGANLYLKKPNNFSGLKSAILNCLEDLQTTFNDKEGAPKFIVQL